MYKVWIVLIIYCTSRAIYLDIGSSSDGLACIKVLQRFSSRYGQPKLIISDNGSNFISKEVQNYASIKGIKWNFNLPKTPWAGRFFERLIKSVKRYLRKLLNVLKVDYENLLKSDSHLPKKIFICLIESPLKIMKNTFYFILIWNYNTNRNNM